MECTQFSNHCQQTTSIFFSSLWRCSTTRAMTSSFLRFLDHARCTTVSKIPLDEWSARRRVLYLTKHNSRETDNHAPGWIRTRNPSKWAPTDPCLRQHRHQDWQPHVIMWHYHNTSMYQKNDVTYSMQPIPWICFFTEDIPLCSIILHVAIKIKKTNDYIYCCCVWRQL